MLILIMSHIFELILNMRCNAEVISGSLKFTNLRRLMLWLPGWSEVYQLTPAEVQQLSPLKYLEHLVSLSSQMTSSSSKGLWCVCLAWVALVASPPWRFSMNFWPPELWKRTVYLMNLVTAHVSQKNACPSRATPHLDRHLCSFVCRVFISVC